MARRTYAFLAGDLSGWPKGMVPTPAILKRLDQGASELVNGEDGGTWAPSSPIVIGPYRTVSSATTPTISVGAGSSLTGDIRTVKGNGGGDELVTPGLVLTGGADPAFQSSRGRTIVVGFTGFTEYDSNTRTVRARVVLDSRTLSPRTISTSAPDRIIAVPLPLKAQHRGATITQVDFRLIVPGQHTALPANALRVRISRITGATATLDPLHSAGGGYDANGYLTDPAATPAQLMNNGQVRTLSYVPDQNNTGLDPDTYWYLLQCRGYGTVSEANNGVGLNFLSATVTLSGITSLRE